MGYRGEDVPTARGDWGGQTPWQPSSGAAPGNAGAWDGASRGYEDETYPPGDGGYGYPPDGGYPGQGQQGPGYAAPDGQYGNGYGQSYEQQPYEQYGGYGPGAGQAGQAGAGGYGGPQGYPQPGDYGQDHGQNQPTGYGQGGYDQPGYDQRPAPGYAQGGGYGDPSGYGQSGGYPASASGSYPASASGSYPASGSGSYPAASASGSYPAQPASGGYPAQPGGSGYPAPRGGGGRLALPPAGHGGYSDDNAGNDWYGGQPAAANGASFADTGTYRLNGSVMDEYGTGPREAFRDPARGYAPGPGTGPLPGQAGPGATGAQPFQSPGPQGVRETRAQQRYDDRAAYPDGMGRRPGDASGGYPMADSFGASGYDGYGDAPSQPGDQAGNGYDDYNGFADPDQGGDPYQELYGDDGDRGGAGRGPGRAQARGGRSPLGGKRLLFAALGVVVVGVVGVAAYAFLFKSNSSGNTPNAQSSLSTAGATPSTQACVQQLGTYCHITAATDDPTPLTASELYPPAFTDETDKTSYTLVATKVDKTCSNAVIGTDLIKAIQAGKCTQVVRGSYVSGDNKIMGTIGVINLSTTNEAHYAGKVVGQNDFIAPLTSKTGVASKLGNGTGIVEAEFKGHYLILTWSEFVNGTNPTTTAEQNQLKQFSNDVVAESANIDLSQRMVTGSAATPAASS